MQGLTLLPQRWALIGHIILGKHIIICRFVIIRQNETLVISNILVSEKESMDRFGFLVVGIVFVLQGINILLARDYKIPYWWGYTYGPYHPLLGALFVIGGAIFVYAGIRNVVRKRSKKP